MRCVIQKVKRAQVSVDNECVGRIDNGLVVLVGMAAGDANKTFEYMAGKIINLRIFMDENDKMNLSVADKGAGILLVPNFTIYGDARGGRRPSFINGAPPDLARELFNHFVAYVKKEYSGSVESGIFQTHMEVELINDGPVTILLDSEKLF